MELPRYESSLLSVTGSVLEYFGAKGGHGGLPLLDKLLRRHKPRNVALLVMDGMGTEILERQLPQDSFLRRYLAASISSVFPPTTVAATTTLESGLSPAEHGWLGWSLYFPEIGTPVDTFTSALSCETGAYAPFPAAWTLLPYESIYARIEAAGQARAFSLSPFSDTRCETLGAICEALPAMTREGRSYVYGYCMEPDNTMHLKGTGVPQVKRILEGIDRRCAALAGALRDTLLIITADHGHRDVEWIYLEDYPELLRLLALPTAVEQRAVASYVKEENRVEFKKRFEALFSADFTLLTREAVLEAGLLGPGARHPRLPGLLGDFMAVATGRFCMKDRRTPGSPDHRAHHAGLTREELAVPLICVPCP